MTLKIDKTTHDGITTFGLSGWFDAECIGELERLIESEPRTVTIILDLRQTRLVNRDGVSFLMRCEAIGIRLENCPAYVREWMQKEEAG
jgi:hypothetical protein